MRSLLHRLFNPCAHLWEVTSTEDDDELIYHHPQRRIYHLECSQCHARKRYSVNYVGPVAEPKGSALCAHGYEVIAVEDRWGDAMSYVPPCHRTETLKCQRCGDIGSRRLVLTREPAIAER